jgi:glycosyltransferase involved in cell wall biosynthesis
MVLAMSDVHQHRILYVHAAPGIPVDGAAGGAIHIREVIRAMDRAGHEVMLVARRGTRHDGDALPDLPCEVEVLPQGTLPGVLKRVPRVDETVYDQRLFALLRSRARAFSPTLVYERFSLFSLAGSKLAAHRGIPLVLEVNAPLLRERTLQEDLREDRFTRRREEKILGSADRVVAVSTALRSFLRQRGVAGARIRCVGNGVDAHRFRPGLAPLEVPAEAGDGLRIGFCGSLKPWHDLDTVLRALARGAREDTLLVVGDGPAGPQLARLADELGLSERITWAGNRSEADVPRLLSGCDLVCVPSPHDPDHYFSPLKLLEGMALGLAVVATDLGDVAGVCGGEEPAALLVPPEDSDALRAALDRLAAEPDLRRRLGAAGRTRAEAHTWDHVLRESIEGL